MARANYKQQTYNLDFIHCKKIKRKMGYSIEKDKKTQLQTYISHNYKSNEKIDNDLTETKLYTLGSKNISYKKIIGYSFGSVVCFSLLGPTYFVIAYLRSNSFFIENDGIEIKLKILSYLPVIMICFSMYISIELNQDKRTGFLLSIGSILSLTGLLLTLLSKTFIQYIICFIMFYGIGSGMIICSIWSSMVDYFLARSCKLGFFIILMINFFDRKILSKLNKLNTLNMINFIHYENYCQTIIVTIFICSPLLLISYILIRDPDSIEVEPNEESKLISLI